MLSQRTVGEIIVLIIRPSKDFLLADWSLHVLTSLDNFYWGEVLQMIQDRYKNYARKRPI